MKSDFIQQYSTVISIREVILGISISVIDWYNSDQDRLCVRSGNYRKKITRGDNFTHFPFPVATYWGVWRSGQVIKHAEFHNCCYNTVLGTRYYITLSLSFYIFQCCMSQYFYVLYCNCGAVCHHFNKVLCMYVYIVCMYATFLFYRFQCCHKN